MKVLVLLLLFTLSAFVKIASAQTSFSVSDTALYIIKSNTDVAVYHFSQFKNLSGKPIEMRWVKRILQPFPDKWRTTVQDPQNFYTAHNKDSADFVLQKEAGDYDKMIAHVLPNWQTGKGTVQYYVFNKENRKDGVWINFHYKIEDEMVTGIENEAIKQVILTKTGFSEFVLMQDATQLLIFDESGKELFSEENLTKGQKICITESSKILIYRCLFGGNIYEGKLSN